MWRVGQLSLLVISLAAVVNGPAPADEPPAEALRFFEAHVRPILAARCYRCHAAEKQKGGLRLDNRAGLLAGGDSGPVVVPGKPEESLLISAIGYADEALQMPPNERLPDREIARLREWVERGAAYPASAAAPDDDGRDFWSFQPPLDPPLPEVNDTDWPQSPLDRFILAELERRGIRPAPSADRSTLLRRATYDLTGLPPTPEEIDAFLADESPGAFAAAIERLLDSPHYGERWGRHWLDIARYADSNGLDENIAFGNAWRYRDYVVAAFNRDQPYDQFLEEQIAGDLLPPTDDVAVKHERLIATGFLSLGAKVLAEVDEKKMEMDIIDEQIDTVGRSVLGLTLGCARCHDHKFDPIPTADYYALAGIFASTRTMDNFKKVARWHENPIPLERDLALQAEHEQRVAEQNKAIEQFVAAANKAADQKLVERVQAGGGADGATDKQREAAYPEETKAQLRQMRDALAALVKRAPELPSAMGVSEGVISDIAICLRGSHLTLGPVVPRHFPRALTGDQPPTIDATQSGRLQLAQWLVQPDHALTSRVMVNRIWRWHFGQGLVRSTDNFGRLGEPPSHPELLDWLARRFIESAWSIKAMHRLILLSATYRLSSAYDERASATDPDNRLHWRMDARRLEAEEIRDALLAVGGLLDRSMGGPVLPVKNREYLFDHTSKDVTRYDSRRRSLYLPVIRNHLYDVFELFDATNGTVPDGNRVATTVAPQALFMMNSELVSQASASLADALLADEKSSRAAADAARIERLYKVAYSRRPSEAEVRRAQDWLASFERLFAAGGADAAESRRRAWASVCQIVLAASEFIYLS